MNYKEQLWTEYISKRDFSNQHRDFLKQIGRLFYSDVSYLYKIYPLIGENDVYSIDEKTKVIMENEDDLYIFRQGSKGIFLKKEEMKRLLCDMITLFEDTLPLGSVVDLKKDKLVDQIDISKVDNFRVVITKRFLGVKQGCFYQYGAVLYPIGLGDGRVISFTPALIDRLIYMGYSDEVEQAFAYQMKHQLVIEQNRKSVGFATPDELEETRKLFLEEIGEK